MPRPKAPTEQDWQMAKVAVARRFEVQPSGRLRVPLTLYLDREPRGAPLRPRSGRWAWPT